jgi:hypothetical protein
MTHIETTRQFVIRKLQSSAYNHAAIVRSTGINKATLSELSSGKNKDPLCSTVEKLAEYFKGVDK